MTPCRPTPADPVFSPEADVAAASPDVQPQDAAMPEMPAAEVAPAEDPVAEAAAMDTAKDMAPETAGDPVEDTPEEPVEQALSAKPVAAESIADKLARIRAVVAKSSAEPVDAAVADSQVADTPAPAEPEIAEPAAEESGRPGFALSAAALAMGATAVAAATGGSEETPEGISEELESEAVEPETRAEPAEIAADLSETDDVEPAFDAIADGETVEAVPEADRLETALPETIEFDTATAEVAAPEPDMMPAEPLEAGLEEPPAEDAPELAEVAELLEEVSEPRLEDAAEDDVAEDDVAESLPRKLPQRTLPPRKSANWPMTPRRCPRISTRSPTPHRMPRSSIWRLVLPKLRRPPTNLKP